MKKEEKKDNAQKARKGKEQGIEYFQDPKNYVNRELSWLEFDCRVLEEARDKTNPLFDRLKFLSITASNLDEFFMVRVASLKDMVHAGYKKPDIAGMTAQEQLDKISVRTHELVVQQYNTYNRSLLPALRNNGLNLIECHEDLTPEQGKFVDRYFREEVYPVLTPMAVDSSRPFPLVRNKSLNIAALLKKKDGDEELEFAMVQVPAVLPRIISLPVTTDEDHNETRNVIFLEEIIERNMQQLFLNYDIVTSHPFRIMRNADFSLDEEEAVDLLEEIEKQLKRILSQFLPKGLAKLDPQVREILRAALAQARYMQVPASAAVNEAVKLTRTFKKASASGLVNAVLRRAIGYDLGSAVFADEVERLMVLGSAGRDVAAFLHEHYPDEALDILTHTADGGLTSLRANPLKVWEKQENILR